MYANQLGGRVGQFGKGCIVAAGSIAVVEAARAALPRPDHVVIVIEENHSYSEVLGSSSPATYIKSLATAGASFTGSFGVEHPSQPNYLDLFSGNNQGTTGTDNYPTNTPFTTANLGAQLRAARFTFAGYSEDLPSVGSTVDSSGYYRHKHNPWANWQASSPTANQLPSTTNLPFTSFPTDYSKLPSLSFVVPNQLNDMHDGTIQQADTWLRSNINGYYQWARTHNSMLIVTTDEDDKSASNQVATIFDGPMVRPGTYSQTINHFSILRTLEDIYGLSHIGGATSATTITSAFYTLPGDANSDGKVGTADFTALAANFNASGKNWPNGDFNGDGKVNALDFNILASNFGSTAAASTLLEPVVVPEPCVSASLTSAFMLLRVRQRHRRGGRL